MAKHDVPANITYLVAIWLEVCTRGFLDDVVNLTATLSATGLNLWYATVLKRENQES